MKNTLPKGPARNVKWYPYSNLDVKRGGTRTAEYTQIARSGDIAYDIFGESPWYAEIILANTSSRPVLVSDNSSSHYPLVYGEVFERGNEQKSN